MVSRPWPFETIIMAVLLEQEKRIRGWFKGLVNPRLAQHHAIMCAS
jgi:hypothetical protein